VSGMVSYIMMLFNVPLHTVQVNSETRGPDPWRVSRIE